MKYKVYWTLQKYLRGFKNVITLEHFQSGIKQLNIREKILKDISFISSFILIKTVLQINFTLTKGNIIWRS